MNIYFLLNSFEQQLILSLIVSFVSAVTLVFFRFSWISFRFRFWIIGIVVASWTLIQTMIWNQPLNEYELYLCLVSIFIIAVILAKGINGLYNYLRTDTPFRKSQDEEVIAHDSAKIVMHGNSRSGRIILTTKRLCFIANHAGRTQYDFFLEDNISENIACKWGLPIGISFSNGSTKIYVKFPFYWHQEIRKIITASKLRE